MMKTVFNYLTYKDFLRDLVKGGPWGAVARLARAAGCQPSYLSQVLLREVELTPDHALKLGQHIGLSEPEMEYWLLLVDDARAATPELRDFLRQKLREARARVEHVGSRLQRKAGFSPAFEASYYQSWIYVAVHLCTDIEACQTQNKIAERLSLSREQVGAVLNELESAGLVKREGTRWIHSGRETHVDRNSPNVTHHHMNWRQQAIMDAQRKAGAGTHFTSVYAISRTDYLELKEKLLNTIQEFHQQMVSSRSETLVCFTTDLFEL